MDTVLSQGINNGLDAINVVGRAAMFLGTAIDNAIEVRAAQQFSTSILTE